MISRTKLKSVSEAAGKPTSISLKPSFTSMSNRRRFFSAPIGSISAWLPSRKSTLHQVGALSMTRDGHCRSGKFMGAKGRYLWIGIDDIGNSYREAAAHVGRGGHEQKFAKKPAGGQPRRPPVSRSMRPPTRKPRNLG